MDKDVRKKIQEFCKNLPKVELHAHLNGSLSKSTLIKLGCLEESVTQYQKLKETDTSDPKAEGTLQECFQLFKIAHNATSNANSIYLATESVIKDFAEENVIYLELRTTPRIERNMSKEQYIEAVVKAIKEKETDMMVNLILSIDRKDEEETSWESFNVISRMKDKYPDIIKGIDLSGNPVLGTFNKKLFTKARESGLLTAIHCAEVKNDEEVERILNFCPDRIGHGTYIHPNYGGSQKIWDLYCKKKIPLECCLTSNIICGTSKSYESHHIQEWIKNNLPFSVNTDDKGVFSTNLSKEYELVQKYYNVTLPVLWSISNNAIDHSFANSQDKIILKKKMKTWFQSNF